MAMITPKGQHYRRQYDAVPVVDPARYRLQISCEQGATAAELSLDELAGFSELQIRVTMMCTGNRRSEFNTEEDGETMGLPWKNGSISTARWYGCSLLDVLKEAGIDPESTLEKGYRFLTFYGIED